MVWDEKYDAIRPDSAIIKVIWGLGWFWVGNGTKS